MNRQTDIITPEVAGTLPALFRERVRRSPDACAYRHFTRDERCCETVTWEEVAARAARWQEAMRQEGLQAGDRVAIMLRNGLEWVLFDLAALGLGLVMVPLFANDRPENVAFIMEETGARLLLMDGASHRDRIRELLPRLAGVERIVSMAPMGTLADPRLVELDRWLPEAAAGYDAGAWPPEALATIVYTSGTTGPPKGVMLSHANIIDNAFASISRVPVFPDDRFLSFLPLSHTLERTVGYYIPLMAGACVTHVRSLETLADDFKMVRPTIIIAVPRVFERVYGRLSGRLAAEPRWRRRLFNLTVEMGWQRFQGSWSPRLILWPLLKRLVADQVMAALGGRVRVTISGGAPLNPEVARVFISLGLPILQGYGLTETSPTVSVNTEDDNRPDTVGRPIPGVEVKTAGNGELLIRGPGLMAGYWRNPAATAAAIDREGWFHSGDQATIDETGRIRITGRLKEIIVLANGEKVPPADLELAIAVDPLFEQVLVLGEGRPFLAALVVLNRGQWERLADRLGLDRQQPAVPPDDRVEQLLLERIAARLARFPGYAKIRRVWATSTPWEVDEGLLTATMKLRRQQLLKRFAPEIERLYEGH